MTSNRFTVVIERDDESGMYIGYIPSLPAAHSFAESIDELNIKMREVLLLCLEEMSSEEIDFATSKYVGMSELSVDL